MLAFTFAHLFGNIFYTFYPKTAAGKIGTHMMKIIHVFRAPVGGLFRHVLDLARGQISRGHQVGIIADSLTGSARSDKLLNELAPDLMLGLTRVPMHRQPSPLDVVSLHRIRRQIVRSGVQIVHGHGAKGGALARLVPIGHPVVRVYTPHGGSLHDAVSGRLHLLLERLLMPFGNLYLFESGYSHDAYLAKIGHPNGVVKIIHNGLAKEEFEPVSAGPDSTDILFLGELRMLKGVDILIDAISILHRQGFPLTATIVGDGPAAQVFRSQTERLGLSHFIRFCQPMPAKAAMALGHVLAMPSRAESLPYVVLEAAAAGKPIVATRVGGIPEIFGPLSAKLVAPGDAAGLAASLKEIVIDRAAAAEFYRALQKRAASLFSLDQMVDHVVSAYLEASKQVPEKASRARGIPAYSSGGSDPHGVRRKRTSG